MFSQSITMDHLAKLKAATEANGSKSAVFYMSREAYIDLRQAHDPYGIYRQRRFMSRVLPDVVIYRGDEWWHD
ncbi:hypothetical protein [Bradyrhizobium elkanii]|jgi:hypothetical protein|uniref:hypothetical protein n=1 Tax=Bradyrhizobium elkanii TaxID=29448 RepID=UPI001449FC00|nr:hypothetical protein [Bradyrhizobium elkanii]MCP1932523.1 hypothetical protein [Bradyrhizobium elkanii]MCS3479550.1 hypothetical protein [Bradyrhizobium elkanii]MCS3576935.1 hypothetical protein [Bradyrhizobium elkanii]MCS3719812.1 hypothetical protein [Bradyrhizobium elkanii]MCS4004229.1 hypothetical protein [Bradyrhizobium elkanii USDA 61]